MQTFKRFILQDLDEELLQEKNWIKAYKIHSKIEKNRGNKLWKWRHAAAATIGGAIAAGVASKDYGTVATNVMTSASLLVPHVKDVMHIKKKLDSNDKREADNKAYHEKMAPILAKRKADGEKRAKTNARRRELRAAKKK